MDQSKTQPPPNPPYFGPYPLKPNNLRGYNPSNTYKCSVPSPILPPGTGTEFSLGYWELVSPALFGTAGAFLFSIFTVAKKDNPNNPFDGIVLKIGLVSYSIFALAGVYEAIKKVVKESRPSYNDLFAPIAAALVTVILLLSTEYLLLYRYLPSSFKGDIGENVFTQFLSFLYLSSTTIATAGLGDIQPANFTARALITIEIMFYVFVLATALPLLLVEKVE